jgi:hypothetical protein
MEPIDSPASPDAPYRLPSRHPSADRGNHRSPDGDAQVRTEGRSTPPTTAAVKASEIKRRQEALLLTYLIHRPGRY